MPRNRRDCSHHNPRIPRDSSVIDHDYRRDAYERPIVALLFPRFDINAARAARRRGNYHLGQNFARFEHVLARGIYVGQCENLFERNRAFTRAATAKSARPASPAKPAVLKT